MTKTTPKRATRLYLVRKIDPASGCAAGSRVLAQQTAAYRQACKWLRAGWSVRVQRSAPVDFEDFAEAESRVPVIRRPRTLR